MDIRYVGAVIDQLGLLSSVDRERVLRKMLFFSAQKDPLMYAKRLAGYSLFRFRIGKYRIICDVESDTLRVLAVAKRDDVYRDL